MTLTPDPKFETEMSPIIASEFAKRATDFSKMKVQAERVLPELLLFGELPRLPYANPQCMMSHSISTGRRAQIADLRSLLDPSAQKALRHVYSDQKVDDLLASTWVR